MSKRDLPLARPLFLSAYFLFFRPFLCILSFEFALLHSFFYTFSFTSSLFYSFFCTPSLLYSLRFLILPFLRFRSLFCIKYHPIAVWYEFFEYLCGANSCYSPRKHSRMCSELPNALPDVFPNVLRNARMVAGREYFTL